MKIGYVTTALAASAMTVLALAAGSALTQPSHASRSAVLVPKRGANIDFPTIDLRCQYTRDETNSGYELSCDRRSMDTRATIGVRRTVVSIYDDSVIVVQSNPYKGFTAKRDP